MSGALDAFKAFVAEVRQSCDLVEVIGSEVPLRRTGTVFKGLSPFHREKHASLVVWPSTQTWRDYAGGGGRGGDVFTYVQERERMSFKQAVLCLAERTGVKPPSHDTASWQRWLAVASERREVERILTVAASYYHRCLPSDVRDTYFVQHYGFTNETIDQLQLGWSDGTLFDHLLRVGVTRNAALATGLFVPVAGGAMVDFFRRRLIFPYWRGGRVVYFTARATALTGDEPWEQPKYKKLRVHSDRARYISPTVQNGYLFNEDAASGAELLITEGVPDCISAMQCGVSCISLGGTSLRTQDVPRLLELTRSAKRLVICNDSEVSGAGEKAALNLAQQLWAHDREVHIAVIPRPPAVEKIDINELVKSDGPGALTDVLAQAQPYPEYLLGQIPADVPKSELDRRLSPVLELIRTRSSIRADAVLDSISDRFGLRRRTLALAVKQLADRASGHSKSRATQPTRVSEDPPSLPPAVAPSTTPAPPRKPRINVYGRQLCDVVDDAWRAFHAANVGPRFFLRSGRLVHITRNETGAHIENLTEPEMYGHASLVAAWVRVTEHGELDVLPMKEAIRDVFTRPDPTLPVLESVVSTPFFDANGTLVSTPGYHRAACAWYLDDGLRVPPVPPSPTPEDVAAARTLLMDEMLVDFPFTAVSDRTHAMAALLLPFARRLIPDCTPFHLLEAPSPGSGKGLLADIFSTLILGTSATPTTMTPDEEETRKKITSILLRAQPIILLDNIKDVLDSAQLAAALTSQVWSDRILGETRLIDLPNRATWLGTGNNLQLSMEIARRCVRVRIDAKVDRPWQRTGFRHDPLKRWVREHRGELVHALLVLIQAWIAAGRPRGTRTLGSFDEWARTIGGILEHAQIPGFLADTEELYEAADTESQEWRELTAAWWARYGSLWVTAAELTTLALDAELLPSLLGGRDVHNQKLRVAKALSRSRDRHFGNLRIVAGRDNHIKIARYRLVDVSSTTSERTYLTDNC